MYYCFMFEMVRVVVEGLALVLSVCKESFVAFVRGGLYARFVLPGIYFKQSNT